MKRLLSLSLATLLITTGCSLAERPTPRPTLPPPPTLAPDATPLPTLAACAGQSELPPGETVLTLDDFPLGGAFEVVGVTWTGTHFVAVGFGSLDGQGYDGPRQGYVWTSCDGVQWQERIDPTFRFVSPAAVAALGDSVFVLGTLSTCGPLYFGDCDDVAEAGNVILRSTGDGPWQRLAQDPQMQVAYDLEMTAVGSRLAVYGTADDENVSQTLWLSSDGETWQSTTDLAGMDPIDSVGDWGDGLLAFGTLYSDELEDSSLVVATSPDGLRFSAVPAPNPPGATIGDAVRGAAGYAAVGVGYLDLDDFGTVGLALHSPDGTSWSEATATDGSFANGQLDQVHALGSGFAAVGYTSDSEDFTTQQGTIWLSGDGRAWTRLSHFGGDASVFTTSALGQTGMVIFSADEDLTAEEVTGTVSAYFVPAAQLAP